MTLEKCLLAYMTANRTQPPTQRGYKAQHFTVTALHTLNNIIAKGFNQMAPPARTITVALDMSKAFDAVNTHTQLESCYRQAPLVVVQLYSLLQTTSTSSKDAKPILLSETTNPYNVRFKLAFLKVVSYHLPYLMHTQQIFQHTQHRVIIKMTLQSHPHILA